MSFSPLFKSTIPSPEYFEVYGNNKSSKTNNDKNINNNIEEKNNSDIKETTENKTNKNTETIRDENQNKKDNINFQFLSKKVLLDRFQKAQSLWPGPI